MRVTVKIGSSTIAHPTGQLNIRRMEKMCKVLSDLKNMGHDIILVSSGAISMGMGKLLMKQRPKDMPTKQATAAIGQCELMYAYDKLFSEHRHTVGQILLTRGDIENGERRRNFQNTAARLLELGAMPIINENDTVATEEISIGDNVTLSAVVAEATCSDLLILLSDIDGLYSADPRKDPSARMISLVEEITPEILALAEGKGSELGTGGMTTKLKAAQIATEAGIDMVIANGDDPDVLYDIIEGGKAGTRFVRKAK